MRPISTTAKIVVVAVLLIGTALLAWPSIRDSRHQHARKLATAADVLLDEIRELDRAKAMIDEALALDPRCADAWLHLSRWQILTAPRGDDRAQQMAEQSLRSGLTADPTHADSYVMLAFVQTLQERYDAAELSIASARRLGATSPFLRLNEGRVFARQHQPDKAEPLFREVAEDSSAELRARLIAYEELADLLSDSFRREESIATYRKRFSLQAPDLQLTRRFARAQRLLLLDVKQAEVWGRRAAAMAGEDAPYPDLGRTLYLAWAEALITHNDAAKAEKLFAEARNYLPDPGELLDEIYWYPRAHPIVPALVRKGYSLDKKVDRYVGYTTPLLSTTLESDNAAIAAQLLDEGANIEAADTGGSTTLILAAQYGKTAVANVLMQRGASLELRNKEGLDAERAARESGFTELAGQLAQARKARDAQPGGANPL